MPDIVWFLPIKHRNIAAIEPYYDLVREPFEIA